MGGHVGTDSSGVLLCSQGCSIGCPTCTGVKARAQVDTCGKGMKAVVCDERLRTYNRQAACNTKADLYRWNPWRARECQQ